MTKEINTPDTTETPETREKGLEEAAKTVGLDLETIARLAEPLIAQAVAKVLNTMKLPELIDAKITEKANALGAEVKVALERIEVAQQAASAQPAATAGSSVQDTVIAAIAQKIIGGGDSSDSMDKFLDRMMKFQQMGALMYQNPLAQAAQMLTTMMKTAYSMGLEPKQVVEGLSEFTKPPTQPTPKP